MTNEEELANRGDIVEDEHILTSGMGFTDLCLQRVVYSKNNNL